MPTGCGPTLFEFAPVEGRAVVAGFDGGAITSATGALLLGATGRAIGLVGRFVGRIRARWPRVRILLRADSGFAREAVMKAQPRQGPSDGA